MKFLIHVTGASYPQFRSFRVAFLDCEHASISAHTCSKELFFPRNVFLDSPKSYTDFCMAMDAVVTCKLDFNTV